ncbi:MAG TPA: response regulator [Cyclobacteriaceae bacterium]|nr:response regulator [Cyclobacteriaceae bacterium]
MSDKTWCIMLVDDNPNDNFFHEREIKKNNPANIVIKKNSGTKALEYLRSKKDSTDPHPDLIFLDINMPDMSGWEFLHEYDRLDKELQSQAIIVMLTTSQNADDKVKAMKWAFVSDYVTKPLTKDVMKDLIGKYFISASN